MHTRMAKQLASFSMAAFVVVIFTVTVAVGVYAEFDIVNSEWNSLSCLRFRVFVRSCLFVYVRVCIYARCMCRWYVCLCAHRSHITHTRRTLIGYAFGVRAKKPIVTVSVLYRARTLMCAVFKIVIIALDAVHISNSLC